MSPTLVLYILCMIFAFFAGVCVAKQRGPAVVLGILLGIASLIASSFASGVVYMESWGKLDMRWYVLLAIAPPVALWLFMYFMSWFLGEEEEVVPNPRTPKPAPVTEHDIRAAPPGSKLDIHI